MKNNILIRFVLNLLLYTTIAFLLYWLYNPLNIHPNNQTKSSVQFIYQQF
ncbi:MAG: hypothetical protein HND27_06435 [Bacteroidetes bacterium]|nr:hypothetical protein [Flavobacteriales bacterium]NOG95401.1 hypothetical protein [Bacteroidota bacterium]WKZ76350.1 MAG: hypothetical protein QY303_05505 [Vicingaceae bacterium]